MVSRWGEVGANGFAKGVKAMMKGPAASGGPFAAGDANGGALVWLVASAAALGGLLFGYDWVVIGGAKPFYEIYFHLDSPSLAGWAMSCALVGCLIGALSAGPMSARFGRKRLLTLAALAFGISSIGVGLAQQFSIFVLWRIVGGYAIGLASGISPVYIAEIAPARLRGRLVSLNQLAIVFGILLAQIVNWMIARPVPASASPQEILASWNGQWGWRWMFAVTAIPSALFLVATFLVPESPRWLSTKGRSQKAFDVLNSLGGQVYAAHVMEELSSVAQVERGTVAGRELLSPRIVKVVILGCAIAVLQQWCGINVIFNYAQEIFASAGYQISDILFNIVVTGAVNAVFTMVALFTIDRYGRRPLLLSGIAGLIVIYAALGMCYELHVHGKPMLILVVLAIACYAMSLAPVTWVVISEIFPTRVRGTAMSVAVGTLWIACFVLTYTFPILNARLGPAMTFWSYGIVCVIGWLFLYSRLPETKEKSLEQIELELAVNAVPTEK
jgi:SP family sugar porter-like MFS transporter